MKYDLSKGLPENFVYAVSTIVTYRREFTREEGGLVNDRIELEDKSAAYQDYEYISVVEKEPVKLPVELKCECSFDHYGAPLIIFSEALNEDGDGQYVYGRHYEVVLWEKGINFWDLTPKAEGGQETVSLLRAEKPFPAGVMTEMTVKLTRDGIEAQAGGLVAKAECSLPEKMYVGFTACEGINHFRSFSREEI